MQQTGFRRLKWQLAMRLLPCLLALGFTAVALVFAMLLPGQIKSGSADTMRWFVFSAFPLMVVVCIAVFTRFQKRFGQHYSRLTSSALDREGSDS